MNNKFIRIDRKTLIRLSKDKQTSDKNSESINMTYIIKNPIIRYIWWSRLNTMLKLAFKEQGVRVLDFACGEGVFLPSLSANFKTVDAVDIDIDIAKNVKKEFKLDNVNIFEDNIYETKLKDNYYDIIFAASVLEHFNDVHLIFDSLRKKIKKGGALIFSSPSENYIYRFGRLVTGFNKYNNTVHIHYFGSKELADIAKTKFSLIKKVSTPIKFLPFFDLHNVYLFKND
tara:strand:+ start:2201 stop:2887 length:687 start_codon:yes stop_codon:yes gene_type:complete